MNMNDENVKMESPTYCAFCGEIFPTDAPTGLDAIRAHVEVCPKHPIAKYKSRLALAEKVAEAAKRYINDFKIMHARILIDALTAYEKAKELNK